MMVLILLVSKPQLSQIYPPGPSVPEKKHDPHCFKHPRPLLLTLPAIYFSSSLLTLCQFMLKGPKWLFPTLCPLWPQPNAVADSWTSFSPLKCNHPRPCGGCFCCLLMHPPLSLLMPLSWTNGGEAKYLSFPLCCGHSLSSLCREDSDPELLLIPL